MITIKNWQEYSYYLALNLKGNEKDAFREDFLELHPNNQLDFLYMLNEHTRQKLYRFLTPEEFAEIFGRLEPEEQQMVLEELDEDYAVATIRELPVDEIVDFLSEFPPPIATHYLSLLDEAEANKIKVLLGYNDNTAGSLMTTEYVAVKAHQTVDDVLHELKVQGEDAETIYYIYVVAEAHNELLGIVSLREVILSDKDMMMASIMKEKIISVEPTTPQETVVQIVRDYDLLAVPVVEKNELVGIVTVDDIMDVYHEETDEDFGEMANVRGAIDLSVSAWQATKVRLKWLVVLMLVSAIPALAIALLHKELSNIILFAVFVPFMTSVAGNVGMQSLVAASRIKEQEVRGDFTRLVKRDTLSAILLAVICAVLTLPFVYVLTQDFMALIIVGVSMFASIFICAMFGTFMPYVASKFKLDASIASSPFITTLSDVIAVSIYLALAIALTQYL